MLQVWQHSSIRKSGLGWQIACDIQRAGCIHMAMDELPAFDAHNAEDICQDLFVIFVTLLSGHHQVTLRPVDVIERFQHPDTSKPVERRGRKAMGLPPF